MPFQLESHYGEDYPDWGSQPRRPLVSLDFAHRGEWMGSVIGAHPVTGKAMAYQVLRCEFCITTHLWPLSTPEELAQYYAMTFYQEVKPAYLAEYAEDKAWWEMTHGLILDSVTPLLPPTTGVPSMLEVGAGPGHALAVARARGWHTVAIEPSPVAALALTGAGHAIFQGTLDAYIRCHGEQNDFDLLYLYETLEHQPNPEDFVRQCYHLLAPGGILVVSVPNDFSPAQLQACTRFTLPPWWIAAPDHQHYFTPKTLQLLVRRCGFTQRYMRMTFPMVEHFMLSQGQCYVNNPALGRTCHRRRMWEELDDVKRGRWHLLEEEYIANVATRVGREIVSLWVKEGE